MNFDLFKDKFHPSWWNKIKPFIESEKCDKIYQFIKNESLRGRRVLPSSSLTFRAFLETPLNEINCVLLGFCPYHTVTKEGIPVSDGLAFSCSITGKLQPSLVSFYDGLEEDLFGGLNLNYTRNPDLNYLAHQGVLLLNSSLTTEMNKAGSHQEIWSDFTRYILEECLAYTGIPIIFIGKDAQKFNKYVSPLTHGHIFNIEHPAFAARNQSIWETKGAFSTVNRIIRENNGNSFEIDWLGEKNNL